MKYTREQLEAMRNDELNAAVAEKVMGWQVCRDPNCECDAPAALLTDGTWRVVHYDKCEELFCPSTDIAAAWEMVEKSRLCECTRWIGEDGKVNYECAISFKPEDLDWDGDAVIAFADSQPRAICIAAVLAAQEAQR